MQFVGEPFCDENWGDVFRLYDEKLELPFYIEDGTSVLVACDWNTHIGWRDRVPNRVAISLLLETELRHWRHAAKAEPWDTMRSVFLGVPCAMRSSLFVDQETGQAVQDDGYRRCYLRCRDTGRAG